MLNGPDCSASEVEGEGVTRRDGPSSRLLIELNTLCMCPMSTVGHCWVLIVDDDSVGRYVKGHRSY
jgi:hypothetical protein